MSEKFAKQS